MILFKKSYAEQLIQLALTLSFLRVNPDNYLGWGWQSQLALNNGDGWLLELHAPPAAVPEYPYSNRKAVIPLIEDLVRFDRYRHTSPHDIQTYLLNIQNEQKSNDLGGSGGGGGGGAQQAAPGGGQSNETATITVQESRNRTDREHVLLPGGGQFGNELDLFLSAEHFIDSTSILDQNLADLNDYADQTATIPYAGLPQKDEPPDIGQQLSPFSYLLFEASGDGARSTAVDEYTDANNVSAVGSRNSTYSSVVGDLSDFADVTSEIKEEQEEDEEEQSDLSDSDRENKTQSDDGKSSTSGFSSTVELTEEVSSFEF